MVLIKIANDNGDHFVQRDKRACGRIEWIKKLGFRTLRVRTQAGEGGVAHIQSSQQSPKAV